MTATFTLEKPSSKLVDSREKFDNIQEAIKLSPNGVLQNFFILQASAANKKFYTLKDFIVNFKSLEKLNLEETYFCFPDNSEFVQPSWLMRIYAAFLYYKW